MDKMSIIRLAYAKVGGREYVEDAATRDPVQRVYDYVMRQANARYEWSFCRVLGERLESKERRREREDARLQELYGEGDGRGARGAQERRYEREHFELPEACLILHAVRGADGEKVRHWKAGVDPGNLRAVVETEWTDGEVWVEYTADLIKLGGNVPDHAQHFIEAVVYSLAAELAQMVNGDSAMMQAYRAESERIFMEAITQDARQYASNDQHPLRGILQRNILR